MEDRSRYAELTERRRELDAREVEIAKEALHLLKQLHSRMEDSIRQVEREVVYLDNPEAMRLRMHHSNHLTTELMHALAAISYAHEDVRAVADRLARNGLERAGAISEKAAIKRGGDR